MLAGWKILDIRNNSLNIDLSEEEMDNHYKDYWTDTDVRPK
jgi:hypothetical protein